MARMAATLQFSHLISPKFKVVAMQWLADYWWIISSDRDGMEWDESLAQSRPQKFSEQ